MSKNIDYFCGDSIRQDLKGKTARGGVYTAAAQLGGVAIQLLTLPILARLLTKDDFGLVAMALVFTGFASMFVDAGMSMATVQREKITHGQVSNLFWLSSGLGLLMALVTAAFAPVIAWFFDKPELTPVVVALAVPFIFAGMTSQHKALLTRTMRFKKLAAIQVAANLLARAVAVALAWQYRSYWALAAGHASLPVFTMLLTWWGTGWRPSLPRRGTGMRPMVGFGANLTGFSTINYFARNADNLLIGKFWGEGALGVYDQAYKLFVMPMRKVNGPMGTVAVPALCRLANESTKFSDAYLRMIRILFAFLTPAVAAVAVTAHWWIDVILSPEWSEVTPVFRWLTVAGLIQPLSNSTGWLFISQGKTREMLTVGVLASSCSVLSFFVGLPWGPVGVAAAYALSGVGIRVPLLLYWMHRHKVFDPKPILLTLFKAAPITAAVVAANLVLVNVGAVHNAPVGVTACVVISAITWWSWALCTRYGRTIGSDLATLKNSMSPA